MFEEGRNPVVRFGKFHIDGGPNPEHYSDHGPVGGSGDSVVGAEKG